MTLLGKQCRRLTSGDYCYQHKDCKIETLARIKFSDSIYYKIGMMKGDRVLLTHPFTNEKRWEPKENVVYSNMTLEEYKKLYKVRGY